MLIAGLTGYVSLASIVTSALFPVVIGFIYPESGNFWVYLSFAIVLAAITIFSHRSNIRRLINGNENRINFKKIRVKPDETKG